MAGESMVIVDPKGELVRKSEEFLERKGYQKVVLDWRKPQESPDRWNPFERVQEAYKRGKRAEAENHLNDILQSLFFERTEKGKDPYWNDTAGQLARGISKLILMMEERLSIKSILDWRHAKMQSGMLQNCFLALSTDSDIYQDLAGFMNLTAENTKTCIASTFDQLTGLFKASKTLTEMMSGTTFSMEKIGKERTAIFLVVPDEKTTYHFLAALFISQCYESLLDQADACKGELPVRVNFILEEFCNMPKLDDIVSMLTAARSRNIRFLSERKDILKVFLCLDSDTAGNEACTRLAQTIPGENAVIRLAPARKDWNDVLRQQGDIPNRKFIAETITLRELPTAQPVPMLRMADVELTSVDWLWFPYIPFGKLTIIQGNPSKANTIESLLRRNQSAAVFSLVS